MPYLTANAQTWVKRKPTQAPTLATTEKFQVAKGQKFGVLDSYDDVLGHARILMADKLTVGGSVWKDAYIWAGHWSGISDLKRKATASSGSFSRPGSAKVLQPAPYFAQNDNKDWNDDGSVSSLRYGAVQCGLTSLAMVLATIWPNDKVESHRKEAGGQFEDWVAAQLKKHGLASTSAADHVALLDKLGIKARFTTNATVGELKESLEKHPCVLGTAYKASGHFITAVGFDRATGAVIVNDPYGKRQLTGSYNNWEAICQSNADKFGQGNLYTPDVLNNIWVDGGEASGWAVFLDPTTPNYGNGSEPIVFSPKSCDGAEGSPVEIPGPLPLAVVKKAIDATDHPELPAEEVEELATALLSQGEKYGILTPLRLSHFLAQLAHESGGYWWLEEIASGEDYEGRDDLGNTQPGDGKRYKGRGLIQLTGRANYAAFAKATGVDAVGNPEQVGKYPLALTSALYFWDREKLNSLADEGSSDANVTAITRVINGGTNGLSDRLEKFAKLQKILGC